MIGVAHELVEGFPGLQVDESRNSIVSRTCDLGAVRGVGRTEHPICLSNESDERFG